MVMRVYSIDLVQVERNSDTQKKEYTELAQSKSFDNNWIKLFNEQIKSVINIHELAIFKAIF